MDSAGVLRKQEGLEFQGEKRPYHSDGGGTALHFDSRM